MILRSPKNGAWPDLDFGSLLKHGFDGGGEQVASGGGWVKSQPPVCAAKWRH
jgi:hypothetical protein